MCQLIYQVYSRFAQAAHIARSNQFEEVRRTNASSLSTRTNFVPACHLDSMFKARALRARGKFL